MLLHIVGQQISAIAAFAIYDRISAATGGIPTPAAVLGLGQDRLRACGLSEARSGYALALAEAQTTGTIDIEHLGALGDSDDIAVLTAVRGIGTWSAETFLIHNLHRPDVLPAGDLGIRLDTLPLPREVRSRASAWIPWRSYAAAMLWRSLRPPGEASDPKHRALVKLNEATYPSVSHRSARRP